MYEDFSETSKNATELTDSSERNPEQNQQVMKQKSNRPNPGIGKIIVKETGQGQISWI